MYVYVCIYICIYIYMYICVCACVSLYVFLVKITCTEKATETVVKYLQRKKKIFFNIKC